MIIKIEITINKYLINNKIMGSNINVNKKIK